MSKKDKDRTITITQEMADQIVLMVEYIPDISELEKLREDFAKDKSDSNLARVFAETSNLTFQVMHMIDDPDNTPEEDEKYIKETNLWLDYHKELINEIINRLKKSNIENNTNYITENIPYHYITIPFMEKHGYRDGCGWWVK